MKAVGRDRATEMVMRGYPLPQATANELRAARAEVRRRIIHSTSSSFTVRINPKDQDLLSGN